MKELEIVTGHSIGEIKDLILSMVVESALQIDDKETRDKRIIVLNALYDLVGEVD